MRYAVADIGSNTVRMNIYDTLPDDSGKAQRILSECDNLGLLNYIADRCLSDEGISRLTLTIQKMKNLADKVGCDGAYFFATAGLRNTDNARCVIDRIREATGIEIEILTGEAEALLSFSGLKYTFGDALRSGIMIDMGGGSTELIGFIDGMAVRAASLQMGSLFLYQRFVSDILPQKDELKEIKKHIDKRLSDFEWLDSYGSTVYLVGGTARAVGTLLSQLKPDCAYIRDGSMQYDEICMVYNTLKHPTPAVIKLLVRTVPDRLPTIIPGLAAYVRILNAIGAEKIIVSPTGVREGYLAERLLNMR